MLMPPVGSATAHRDLFARQRLPPPEQLPEFLFDLPELQFGERLNCAVELLDRAVHERGWGERTAIRDEKGASTYRELLLLVDRIAAVLVDDLALIPGNRVLLHGFNNRITAAIWLAVVKAGGIVVTTMPMLRAGELGKIIAKAEISHALCDSRLLAEVRAAGEQGPWLRQLLSYGENDVCGESLESRLAGKASEFAAADTASDDICMIAFTSGTTGEPKGTMHFHRDVMAICACFPRAILQARADDIFCGTPPLGFSFGLGGLLLFPLASGASSVLFERLTPETLLHAIEECRCTVLFTVPTFYRMMAPLATRSGLSSLRHCVSAGEALPPSTRERWELVSGARMIDGIGATEMLHVFISADAAHARPGVLGQPLPGYRARIVDASGRPLPQGVVGHLAVKGPTGCRYLDDARQTAYVMHGWNITGDACLIDERGDFVFQARTDDMIITAGYNVGGPEVEAALLQHPAVAEAGVVGVADDERGQVIKAYVVLQSGYPADATMAETLQDFVKLRIAPYKYPRLIEFRALLPRAATGKLQRYKLREEKTK